MARDSALDVSVGIIAAVVVSFAAYQAADVFAPLALALFIIAIVWPLQSWLQARMPGLLALAITMMATIAVCVAFAIADRVGFWPCRRVPDRGLRALPDALQRRDHVARGPRGLGRGRMERIFQRRVDTWLGETGHRARQHHPELLAYRPRLRHSRADGGRGPSPADRISRQQGNRPDLSWRRARRRRRKCASTWRSGPR